MKILLLDTNVLIYIIEKLYDADKTVFIKVFGLLLSEYKQLWIPGTVRKEFLAGGKRYKKLYRRLRKLSGQYPILACPIKIPQKEIEGLLKDIDPGEADALLQARKAPLKLEYNHYQIIFMTNDKAAQLSSPQMDVACLSYQDFKSHLKEAGIAIP
jgi:hypothetical protein